MPKIFSFVIDNLEYVIQDNKPAEKELYVAKKEESPIKKNAEFILDMPLLKAPFSLQNTLNVFSSRYV